MAFLLEVFLISKNIQKIMKKIFLLLLITSAFNLWCNGQCDKKVLWTSVKEEFTNSKDEVQKTEQDKVTVEVSKENIVFMHNDDPNDVMQGTIKEINCNWTEPYKNGKTVIKTELKEGQNDVHDGIITIEGKDGKIIITVEMTDNPDMKIKAYVDKYEEKA